MIRLYNTLTRQKEEFKPVHEGKVGMYVCGPTVYWFAHIGNMRAFLFADVLRRVFEFEGYEVKQVMNITDVGHLTDDMDEGEDKMLVAMRRDGKTSGEIAEFYTNAFMRDSERLNIKPANLYPKATTHIQDQIEMIATLEKNGFTYRTSDGIYFDTSKLSDYGRLSGQKSQDKLAGARVKMGEKRNTTDFALWKLSLGDSKREMEWDSPWGKGFPGWHIECSAMSTKYLDVPFDIHTGGIDHIAVHHENEIAQTQGAYGVLQANFWMHSEFLTVDGGKMSKSLGNLYTVQDLIDRGFDPLSLRYLTLEAHYRTKLNFSFEALEGAQCSLERLRNIVQEWDLPQEYDKAEGHLVQFKKEIDDDLNTPRALAVVWDLVHQDIPTSGKSAVVIQMDRVLGLGLDKYVGQPLEVSEETQKMVGERDNARLKKDWAKSDDLRARLESLGFIVNDTAKGTVLKKKTQQN